MRNALFVR